MEVIITLLVFLGILTLLVLVHELGHFVSARKFGIKAEEFGIGLPPRAVGIQKGETLYSLNWLPLGGFVKIKGEQGDHPDDEDSFVNKPIWQRGIVLSAGVIMNVVLAAILLSIGFIIGTPQILDNKLNTNAEISDKKIHIGSVVAETPAAASYLKQGDTIVSVDGTHFETIEALQNYIASKGENELSLIVQRDSVEESINVTPAYDETLGRSVIGIELIPTGIVKYPFFSAIVQGVAHTGILLKEIVFAFGSVISELVRGEKVSVDLSGPVGIAVITSEVTRLGVLYLIQFAALLSLNLAIINFIPFPALDGGRFFFLMIEKIKGSAINQKIEGYMHTAGFVLLMILVLLVTVRDIQIYFAGFWNNVTGIF